MSNKGKELFYKKIDTVFKEHQKKGWDGYDALPISKKNKDYAYKFVDFFIFSEEMAKTVDVIPENAGNLCFEWFVSKDRFLSISIKGHKVFYHFKDDSQELSKELTFKWEHQKGAVYTEDI